MGFKSIALTTTILALSTSANAAIISTDWQSLGDNLITQDDVSGLEWLDLTVTTSRSYNDILSQLEVGGEYEGWRYATSTEVGVFFDAFGGNNAYYNGGSTQNNGLFDLVAPYWGDTYCANAGCAVGDGFSNGIIADITANNTQAVANIKDLYTLSYYDTQDYVNTNLNTNTPDDYVNYTYGHALVRDISAVPVPSAVWLFGSGLVGLVGFARRKKA